MRHHLIRTLSENEDWFQPPRGLGLSLDIQPANYPRFGGASPKAIRWQRCDSSLSETERLATDREGLPIGSLFPLSIPFANYDDNATVPRLYVPLPYVAM